MRSPRPGGKQLVDLNLGAPQCDLLFGPVQPDQLVEARLRPRQHLGLSAASAAALVDNARARTRLTQLSDWLVR